MLFILLPFAHIYASTDQVTDIKGHWAETDIQDWLDKGLITGYPDHTFRPEHVISRGEFVALVNRVFKYSDKNSISFKDLKQTNWAYIEVQKAIAQGYISGFNDNTFRPDKQITRQETAVILSRILKLKNVTDVISVKDSSLIPSWSKSAINNLLDKGIMSSNPDGTFQPQREMTRAESVVVIKKALAVSTVVYDKAGVFGETAINTVHSDVIIQSSDVTLKNMHILGDLMISKEIGDGDAYLDQVQVDGVTRIEGGGTNSIHIKDSQLGTVSVNRLDNAVRIVAEGTTTIQDTQILSSAIIEENNISGQGFVDLSVLPETKETKLRNISIAGDFNNINVNASVNEFTVRSGTINSLFIKENVVIPSIILNKDVIIQKLELKSKSTISGEGKINGIILSDDAKDSVVSDVKTPTTPIAGGGGGSGGGGGGGGSSPDPGAGTGNPGSESPALAVTSIVAANGTIEVLFNKSLSDIPAASDFKVLEKVDNGYFQSVDVTLVSLLANKTTVKLTFPSIGSSEKDQLVVYSVSYKNANVVLSEAIIVPKSSLIVTGSLFHLDYNETTPVPIYNMTVYLTGVHASTGTYTSITNQSGNFKFNNVVPGTYIINIFIGLTRYYTDEFTVEAGKDLSLPDIIIKEKAPVSKVDKEIYTDIAYLNGSVMNLKEPFSVKVELEDGTVLNSLQGTFDMFFGFNLFDYNPDLVLKDNDKVYVTMYADSGWTSERFEVNVVERPKTNSPVVTSVVYDDSKYIRGTIEDSSYQLTVTKMDGTLIGQSYNNIGSIFSIYLYDNQPLSVGEKLVIYAQADRKRKSDSVYVTVVAPNARTAPPAIEGILYEDDWHITGKAEGDSKVIVKRSDGTVIGEGKAGAQEYGGKFDLQLSPRPIAGETLYLSAKGYERIISEPTAVVVANRPITPSPTIVGEVYSDYTYIQATVPPLPSVQLYLKDMNGVVIADGYAFNEVVTFYYLELVPNGQYQLTAIAPGLKESVPFIFTVKAPTVITSVPTVTTPIYTDEDYQFSGMTEPYATVYLYYEDGTLIYGNQANELGIFTLPMPAYPRPLVLPGTKLMIKADAIGKLLSEALVITATAPIEKSSQPVLNNDQVYGYTTGLSGTAAKSTVIEVFHEDGRQIFTGVYSDMNTGQWSMGLWSTILRGGDRIYIITDEVGKLPSEPLYITIQPAPKAVTPVVTSTVSTESKQIKGTYSGALIIMGIPTTIFLVNENNQVIESVSVMSDGSFSLDIGSNPLITGQMIQIIAKEGQKEASDPVVITVN